MTVGSAVSTITAAKTALRPRLERSVMSNGSAARHGRRRLRCLFRLGNSIELIGRSDDHAAVGNRRRRQAHFAERVLAQCLELGTGLYNVGVAVLAEREDL